MDFLGGDLSVVVVTGAAGNLGRRVLPILVADERVRRIVAVDVEQVPVSAKTVIHSADLLDLDLVELLRGVGCVIHLASSSRTETDQRSAFRVNVDGTARLLEAAGLAGVRHVVAVSSAMVYGAWPNNPVPLTEDAALRPNADLAFAAQKLQLERLVGEWSDGDLDRTAAVLRPVSALSEGEASFAARLLAAATAVRAGDNDPPMQFVTFDDLASAIDVARRERLDGPFNVAPDGWIPAETVRALTGAPPRLRLPSRVAAKLATWSWELQLGPVPPGLLPYTMHPWVVANDRLKAAGWAPTATNEEAYVAGTEGSWWSVMSPKRKQELALGASGAALLVSGAAVAHLARQAARRRRS